MSIAIGPIYADLRDDNRLKTDGPSVAAASGQMARHKINLRGDAHGHIIGVVVTGQNEPVAGADVQIRLLPEHLNRKVTVKTDKSGAFVVNYFALVAGCRPKELEVSFSDGSDKQQVQFPVSDLAVALTFKPQDSDQYLNLNGKWRFQTDPPQDFWKTSFQDEGWSVINIPSHWVMQGFDSKQDIGGYRRWIDLPARWKGKRIKIRFEGVHTGAEVWLNDKRAGYHDGGATPFEFDLTDYARPGERNLLSVRVTEHTESSDLDAMSWYAHLTLAGIYREVNIYAVPETYIARLQADTELDKDYHNATLQVHLAINNDSEKPVRQASTHLKVTAPNDLSRVVAEKTVNLNIAPWTRQEIMVEIPVTEPEKWNPEHPVLYTLSAVLSVDGQPDYKISRQIGLREIEIKGVEFQLNGVALKLRGADRHDAHTLMGRAITPEVARKDLELMKACNMNGFRTSHYPPMPDVIEIADQLGFGVEEEAALCFVGASWGPAPADGSRPAHNPWLLPVFVQQAAEMVERDRSHPSVLWWSMANESDFGNPMHWMRDWIKKLDPTRPASCGQFAQFEITMMHNPTLLKDIAESKRYNTPILGEEASAIFQGMGENGYELVVDPGLRDLWVVPFIPIMDEIQRCPWYIGIFTWAWADDLFLVPNRGLECGRVSPAFPKIIVEMNSYVVPDRGLVGEFTWGVLDGWQRQRPEWWHHKKLYSPIKIEEKPVSISAANTLDITIDNRFDFTNLNEIQGVWRIDAASGTLDCNIAPRCKGNVILQVPDSLMLKGKMLELEFKAADGRLIDIYRLPIGEAGSDAAAPQLLAPAPEIRYANKSLATLGDSQLVRVIGRDFEVTFDKQSGRLWRCLANGRQAALDWPILHVLPNTDAFAEYPAYRTWRPKKVDVREEEHLVVFTIQGSYQDFEGQYDIKIDGNGNVETHYRFEYFGPDICARQIGLKMTMPFWCDTLSWDRNAEWSVYPGDHIGRPIGTAKARPNFSNPIPPTQSWSLDTSPMGSNDFRSAKRNIKHASLTDEKGAGIQINSDGKQTVRAFVNRSVIDFHILDYYGGTRSSNTDIWERNYGVGKKLSKGDIVEGTVTLSIRRPASR